MTTTDDTPEQDDPNFPILTTASIEGTIRDINLDDFTAKIYLDDGTIHDVVYAPALVQEGNTVRFAVNEGDRVVWHIVAEDGWINAYDFYLAEKS